VGATFGLASSVGVAFLQFWPEWTRIAVILGIFLAGQLLADYVLTPRVMGSRLGVHPFWLIFGLFSGGALFGFLGVLLSIPATATAGVLVRFFIRRYKNSPLYKGTDGS
jgi:predicted PurR-regulated permease PerM